MRPNSVDVDKRNIGFRLLGGSISDGRDHVFFVEERSHTFLRDSPLKFGEGFVVARKVFVPHLGRLPRATSRFRARGAGDWRETITNPPEAPSM